jgi:plastocyanin
MAAHIIRGRMRRPLTLAAVTAVALAGCGGGGGGGRTVTVGAGKPVVVKADEYKFDPGNITVKASGGAIRLQLSNDGAQAHDLHVERGGEDLGGTPVFGPGQTKTATVKLAPGKYDFVCTVGDHEQLGMKGTLTVK